MSAIYVNTRETISAGTANFFITCKVIFFHYFRLIRSQSVWNSRGEFVEDETVSDGVFHLKTSI